MSDTGWPANDPTFTEQPRLWHVQLADESRDCDGTYPLTAHYVWARCEDEASNRADEDFDMAEGVSVTGQYDTRPADDGETRAWLAAALQEVGGDNTELTREFVNHHQDAWADTHDGYTSNRVYVIRCLWCEFHAEDKYHREAKSLYDVHVEAIHAAGHVFFLEDRRADAAFQKTILRPGSGIPRPAPTGSALTPKEGDKA
jgi:hypothetical protein